MSLISVIMPYRQKKEYVHKAIRSVLVQTYKNFELIIIFDDEKKDDLNFIKSITKNKKKIKIIINKKNIGAGASRNKGIKKAKGKYIAFIDSDDFWKPNKLKKQIEFIELNKYPLIELLTFVKLFFPLSSNNICLLVISGIIFIKFINGTSSLAIGNTAKIYSG